MLAAVTVSNALDDLNGNVASIAELIADPGPDGISLREAVIASNATDGADFIDFEATLSGQTILLGGTELEINETLAIDASSLTENVTIDAQELSRVVYFREAGDLSLSGLTLRNGRTTSEDSGGAGIRFRSEGTLTISNSEISDNSTSGHRADGGGIYSSFGTVLVTDSTVTGNSTSGDIARGGGVYAISGTVTLSRSNVTGNSTSGVSSSGGGIRSSGEVMLIDSTVSDNHTAGDLARGGGIRTGNGKLTITRSIVSGNSTLGDLAYGGGISSGDVTVTDSTVAGNSTAGERSAGGGIVTDLGNITLISSTVSNNSTAGDSPFITYAAGGGGVFSRNGDITIANSTISGNSTSGINAVGGGIYTIYGALEISSSTVTGNSTSASDSYGGGIFMFDTNRNSALTINNSIVAGNTIAAGGTAPDLVHDPDSLLTLNYSLIGDTSGTLYTSSTGVGNILDQDPMLSPLADNGGLTWTHALQPGSSAVNAGDPAFSGSVYDQRGAPFVRIYDGRVDMGSYESQPTQPVIDGDFNHDGIWDCADIDSLVSEIAANTDAALFDLTGDGQVDLADRDAWLAEAGARNLGPGRAYIIGDADLNGVVDISDFNRWNANKFKTSAEWCRGDFSANGAIDLTDFNLWNAHKFSSVDQVFALEGRSERDNWNPTDLAVPDLPAEDRQVMAPPVVRDSDVSFLRRNDMHRGGIASSELGTQSIDLADLDSPFTRWYEQR